MQDLHEPAAAASFSVTSQEWASSGVAGPAPLLKNEPTAVLLIAPGLDCHAEISTSRPTRTNAPGPVGADG